MEISCTKIIVSETAVSGRMGWSRYFTRAWRFWCQGISAPRTISSPVSQALDVLAVALKKVLVPGIDLDAPLPLADPLTLHRLPSARH